MSRLLSKQGSQGHNPQVGYEVSPSLPKTLSGIVESINRQEETVQSTRPPERNVCECLYQAEVQGATSIQPWR
jgi:hypothetical protein